jgi:hypothetical protein
MSPRIPIVLALALLSGAALAGDALNVQVAESRLRADAKFWAATVATVRAGERLEVMERKGDWVRARNAAGKVGWIHASAVTQKEVRLAAGSSTVDAGTSTTEVALAGKGFSAPVEQGYRERHGDLDYATVDRIERRSVSAEELRAFLEEGRLADWAR